MFRNYLQLNNIGYTIKHRLFSQVTDTYYQPALLFEWLRNHIELLSLIMVAAIVAFLSLTNLEGYPVIGGWDEGVFLQFSYNLAYYGEFATRNGDVFERLMPLCSVGPSLILPVSLALLVSEGSLIAARLVVVLYLWGTLAGVYLLIRQIGGWRVAIGSLFLFITAGYDTYDTLWMGRQVLGELPALAFMVLGLWIWLKSWQGNLKWLIISGVLLGLAVVTKSQLILILGPSFVLFGLVDRFYYRQLRLTHTLIPVVGVILGYIIWWSVLAPWIVSPDQRAGYLEAQRFSAEVAVLFVTPHRWLANLKLLYTSKQWFLIMVALGYSFYRSRPRNLTGMNYLLFLSFISTALLEYIGIGFPWARYLYPILVLTALCVALLVGDLAGWVGRRWQSNRLSGATFVLVIALLTGPDLVHNVQRITTIPDPLAQKFALSLKQNIPAEARILNWEWEIEFYSQQKFIHPPHRLFNALIDQIYNQGNAPILNEPRIPAYADYLVIGPYTDYIQVFTKALANRPHRLVLTEGPYRLYQLY